MMAYTIGQQFNVIDGPKTLIGTIHDYTGNGRYIIRWRNLDHVITREWDNDWTVDAMNMRFIPIKSVPKNLLPNDLFEL